MAQLITVDEIHSASSPSSASRVLERGAFLAHELEKGNILHFPTFPLEFTNQQIEVLLKYKKNFLSHGGDVLYHPRTGKISNSSRFSSDLNEEMSSILWKFSQWSLTLLSKLLTPYSSKWHLSSVRFFCDHEHGEKRRTKGPFHTDALSSQPLHGDRILHFYVNIHPEKSREWITSDHFVELMEEFGPDVYQNCPCHNRNSLSLILERLIRKCSSGMGFSHHHLSTFDCFMNSLYKTYQSDKEYQQKAKKQTWTFPPNSCWLAFTDSLSHSCFSQGDILEQKFIVPLSAMRHIEMAPISQYEEFRKKMCKEVVSLC